MLWLLSFVLVVACFLKKLKIFHLSLLLFVLSVDDNLLYVDDDVKVKKISILLMDVEKIISIEVIIIINL